MKQTLAQNTDNNSKSQLSEKSDGSNSSKWQAKKLGEVCEIELGKTPYRGDKSLWDIEKQTQNVWLSIADLLNTDSKFVYDSKEYVTDKAIRGLKVVQKGILLVSFKLTLGRLAFAGRDLFTNEAIAALSIKDEHILDKYFLYQVLSFFDWHKASEGDVKVKGKTLNKAKLKEIPIPLPPLTEQKRIVAILDQAFGEIEKVKANTEQNLKNAKELFQSYLQGVFENKGDDWEEKKLGELCEVIAGGDVPKGNFSKTITKNYIVPIYANGEKKDGLYGYTNIARINEPSITVSARGTIGYSVKRTDPFFPVVRLIVLTPKDNTILDLDFLLLSIKKIDFTHSGTSIPQLTVPMVKDYNIHLPPLAEQKAIVQRLDALRAETQRLESIYRDKLLNLEELKKSILQKAFSGEL
jgi:type I restriction enzyme S subunit